TGGATRTSAGRTGTPDGRPPMEAAGGAASTRAPVPVGRPGTGRRAAGTTTAHHGGQPATPPTTVLVHHPTGPPKLVHHPAAPPQSRPLPAPLLGRPLRPGATTTPVPRGGPPPTTSPRPTTRPWTWARPKATQPVTSPPWSSPRPWMAPGTGRT